MSILRVAVIGAGQVARTSHINHYKSLPDVEICAVCDVNQNAAKMAADEFHIPSWYTDAETMLKEIRPDAVSICVPNKFHCDMTCLCLEYGCHVLCEKPPAVTLKEAERMRDTARRCSRILTFGFHFRHAETIAFLKKKVEAGEMGTLYAGDVTWLRRRGIPGWGSFTNLEIQGGGPLIDIGTHALDLTLWMMDNYEPESVSGSVFRKLADQTETGNAWGDWDPEKFTVEDSAFGFIKMKNGATIVLESSWAINSLDVGEAQTSLCGTKAGADMADGLRINKVEYGRQCVETPDFSAGGVAFFDGAAEKADDVEQKVFYNAVVNGEPLTVKPEQALVVTQILEAIYEAAKSGKTVYFE